MSDDPPVAVYRAYDADGALLYVGASKSPEKRFTQHRHGSTWWHQVTHTEVEWHPDAFAASDAEAAAIAAETPRHNRGGVTTHHTPYRSQRPAPEPAGQRALSPETAAYVADIVARFPPLTEEQRDELRVLLRPIEPPARPEGEAR